MANSTKQSQQGVQRIGETLARYSDWLMGLGVLGLMVTLLTPLPPGVLDVLLAFNITCSLMLLLVTMSVRSSAELSTFPTILLFATLFRLGLNVASTRLILSEGEAGTIIHAFGRYVVGDDLTVGLVVFLILIVIQFVVITKGAGRISEVAARFVLDAMPGKQMAIDADLNAGLIDSDEARSRRASIATEAEFYGSMDGASKFVRGDAIAGLIITALNLMGGIAIGTMNDLSVGEAGQRYSMLTIGDGLVTQVPALLVSTAAAILVTKANSEHSLGFNLMSQVGSRPKATLIAAGMMFAIGLLPGMPSTPFTVLAIVLLLTWRSTRGIEGVEGFALEPAQTEEPQTEEVRRRSEPARGGRGARAAPRGPHLARDRLSTHPPRPGQERYGDPRSHRPAPAALRHARGDRAPARADQGQHPPRSGGVSHPHRRHGGRARHRRAGELPGDGRRGGDDAAAGQGDDGPRLRAARVVDQRRPAGRGRALRIHGDRSHQRARHAPLRGRPFLACRRSSRGTT